jgi:CHAT domain-containing protein
MATGGGTALLLASAAGSASSPALLTAGDLAPARVQRCKLVVLSACSTQIGLGSGLADPESLVRTLIAGGVPLVIASRWDVNSQATASFMNNFYSSLLQGNSGYSALELAAARARSNKDSEHPYYWAAFSAFGASKISNVRRTH